MVNVLNFYLDDSGTRHPSHDPGKRPLRVLAMMYGISAYGWYQRGTKQDSYTQRFAPDWHCDLMEQLSDYKACATMKLDEMAHALGLFKRQAQLSERGSISPWPKTCSRDRRANLLRGPGRRIASISIFPIKRPAGQR